MGDDGGCGVIIGCVALVLIVSLATHSKGLDTGRIEGRCKAHIEYLKTGADTLSFAQKNPECSYWLFSRIRGE